jgi:hypothetical protein
MGEQQKASASNQPACAEYKATGALSNHVSGRPGLIVPRLREPSGVGLNALAPKRQRAPRNLSFALDGGLES